MKKLFFALAFVCTFMLFGCPLQTQNSIDDGSYKIPAWMAGNWKEVKQGNDTLLDRYYVELIKDNTGQMMVFNVNNKGERENPGMKSIMSDIDGQMFLSVFVTGGEMDDDAWFIFRFREISKNEIELTPLKPEIIPFDAKPAEIRAFLSANKNNAEIYSATETGRFTKESD